MVQQVHSRIARRDPAPSAGQNGSSQTAPDVADYDVDLPQDERSYAAQRQALIDAEKLKRFDAVRRAERSEAEQKADRIVEQLKERERQTLWNSKDARRNLLSFKGAAWPIAKACGAEDGVLYSLVQRMPKGAVLHCHLDGTTDAPWLIARAMTQDTLHMRASRPLSSHATLYEHDVDIVFRQLPKQSRTAADNACPRDDNADIWSQSYTPNTWVPVSRARASFPYKHIYDPAPPGYHGNVKALAAASDSPAAAAFDAFVFSLMTLAPLPAGLGVATHNSKVAWTRFLGTFSVIEGLMTHDIRFDYFVESFRTSIRDSISYVEARVNFFADALIGSDFQDSLTRADLVRLVEAALAKVKSELPVGRTFECKIIYSTVRIIQPAELRKHVEEALGLKQQFPNRIIGFDLVGWEDVGVTLKEYAGELLRLRTRAQELGVKLPLCLHAGETLGDGDAIDDNLYDAILLGTRRIGHGFSLVRHPLLMDIVRTRGICIESCPISNQMLGFVDSTAAHPVLSLLGHGLPLALSHDDPCQFMNAGMTPDYYQILSASDHIDLTSLGVLARNSLQYSLVPDDAERQAMLDRFDQQWATLVDEVGALPI